MKEKFKTQHIQEVKNQLGVKSNEELLTKYGLDASRVRIGFLKCEVWNNGK